MIFSSEPKRAARFEFFKSLNENADIESGILGKSILNSDVYYFKIGKGKRVILSVGAHHGMEHISAATLYNVIYKFADNLTRGGMSYGINVQFLLQKFTFWFVPCLNPDGVDMSILGKLESPLLERQIKMNGGDDFSRWQANARGVDLNHNYDFRFFEYKRKEIEEGILPGRTRYSGEYPESEPESRLLASLVRTLRPELVLSFHTQGEEIYFRPRNNGKAERIAKCAGKILGYSVSVPEGLSDFGGLSDYCGEVLGIVSLTVELGKGENPLPYSYLEALTERVYRLLILLPTRF